MTAKGKAERLARLEEAHALRVDAVRAENWAHIAAAEAGLSPADRSAWRDAGRMLDGNADPVGLARMQRACAPLPGGPVVEHPAKAEAEAWEAWDVPDGAPLTPPPAGRAVAIREYLEACAAWCDREAARVPLSADVQRMARWGAALYRFEAALCTRLDAARRGGVRA